MVLPYECLNRSVGRTDGRIISVPLSSLRETHLQHAPKPYRMSRLCVAARRTKTCRAPPRAPAIAAVAAATSGPLRELKPPPLA
jgi:hypothetical protein